MEYTRITPNGEEKCSLLDGDGMTIEEMRKKLRKYCINEKRSVGCSSACLLYKFNCYATQDMQANFLSKGHISQIEEAYALITAPNFVKANPDDEVDSEGDAVESGTRYEKHRAICEKLNDIYRKKNTDYGNSFGIGFAEYGLIMPVIRLEDKFQRFKRLALGGEQNVADESIKDTLLDLANYAIMTLVEMEAEK